MRRKWQIQRQFQSTPDAERRWDQVYQHLLEWTRPEALSNAPQPRSSAAIDGEMDDENNSNLRTSLDGTSVVCANDRTTGGTSARGCAT